jgi:hypothetical protein
MKNNVIFTILICYVSCSPYPKGLHQDCSVFVRNFKSQWKKEGKSFYSCNEIFTKRKSVFNTNGYLLEQEWEKNLDCLSGLTPNEVKRLFGKPSVVQEGENEVLGFTVKSYYYFIKDTSCNRDMVEPYVPGAYKHNMLFFNFYNGKQTSYAKPRLSLPCE